MQKNLSRDRPGYRASRVDIITQMLHVVCRNGVVWGLTSDRNLVIRVGVTGAVEEGSGWTYLHGSVNVLCVHTSLLKV